MGLSLEEIFLELTATKSEVTSEAAPQAAAEEAK
jgi:hypothetical protein